MKLYRTKRVRYISWYTELKPAMQAYSRGQISTWQTNVSTTWLKIVKNYIDFPKTDNDDN